MFQFYFPMNVFFFFLSSVKAHAFGGGETHYKMCRRKEERDCASGRAGGGRGGRSAVAFDEWAAMHSFSLIH